MNWSASAGLFDIEYLSTNLRLQIRQCDNPAIGYWDALRILGVPNMVLIDRVELVDCICSRQLNSGNQ